MENMNIGRITAITYRITATTDTIMSITDVTTRNTSLSCDGPTPRVLPNPIGQRQLLDLGLEGALAEHFLSDGGLVLDHPVGPGVGDVYFVGGVSVVVVAVVVVAVVVVCVVVNLISVTVIIVVVVPPVTLILIPIGVLVGVIVVSVVRLAGSLVSTKGTREGYKGRWRWRDEVQKIQTEKAAKK